MQELKSKGRIRPLDSEHKRQEACIGCRERHLKCSGIAKCIRCRQDGRECIFALKSAVRGEPPRPLQTLPLPGSRPSTTCVRCRESHLKCTGGTPCTRCAQSGKLCYYISSQRGQPQKNTKSDTFEIPEQQATLNWRRHKRPMDKTLAAVVDAHFSKHEHFHPILHRCPPEIGVPEEQRALKFFCENMMPSLIASNTATNQFWGRLVPQASQAEGAIRHMLVAVSAWSEMISTPDDKRESSFLVARQHHSKALKALTQPHAQPSVVIMLTACLLLMLREGTEDPATEMSDLWIRHALAGLKILNEWKSRPSRQKASERDIILNDIDPVMTQIEFVMAMFLPTSLGTVPQPRHKRPQLPQTFTDHLHMQDTFSEIHRWRYRSACDQASIWTASSPLFKDVRALLKEWYRLVLLYLSDSSLGFVERRAGAIVWAQYRMLEAAFFFSVRTDVPEINHYHPVLVDLSQPGRTVVVRNSATSEVGALAASCPDQRDKIINSLLAASRRPLAAPIQEPSGLWTVRDVWQNDGPPEAVIVVFYAPEIVGSMPGSTSPIKAAKVNPSTITFTKDMQEKHADAFEFIDVADPSGLTKARSYITRQQRRVDRKKEASTASARPEEDHKIPP